MRDMMGMMKQVQELQAKMTRAQDELENMEATGVAGAGMVAVTLSAKGALRGLQIDPSLLNPAEKEILEDLLIAAHADARAKAEKITADKMKDVTGGLPLPPGLKLF